MKEAFHLQGARSLRENTAASVQLRPAHRRYVSILFTQTP
jgi:hypothetical protein